MRVFVQCQARKKFTNVKVNKKSCVINKYSWQKTFKLAPGDTMLKVAELANAYLLVADDSWAKMST